ncbi:MAG: DUF2891 domain-containing protein [Hyphomonadaceae bacterium]|nr:DUF2891 domain-containing protein [Hyphomonadaceae bacterium]
MTTLTPDLGEKFAGLALAHVSREYPNKLDHVMAGAADVQGPRALHPIFFGSFDWHSCVHGYWLLARLLRRYPKLPHAGAIVSLFDERFSAANVAAELAYVERPASRGFERPYGWGWLLALQAELEAHNDGACAPAAYALAPLAEAFATRFEHFLPIATYPVRTGVHSSTSFAFRMAADYVEKHRRGVFAAMRERLLLWHTPDRDAQAWEPSQDDFLSPTLMTAECLRRFLGAKEFRAWFADYLPRVSQGEPQSLFTPASVTDRSDGKIAHLDGLNFSRAWCWRSIASVLADQALQAKARAAADAHIDASLPHVAGDYMGEHWLATFALLALEA